MTKMIHLLFTLALLLCDSDGKFVIDKLEVGHGKDFKIIADLHVQNTEGGGVLGKGTVYLVADFTDDSKYSCQMFTVRNGKERKLLEKTGVGSCTAANTYLESLWLDIQKSAGISNPGECPIQKGNYTIKDYKPIDLTQMKLTKVMPKGTVRADCKLFQSDGKTLQGSIGVTLTKN